LQISKQGVSPRFKQWLIFDETQGVSPRFKEWLIFEETQGVSPRFKQCLNLGETPCICDRYASASFIIRYFKTKIGGEFTYQFLDFLRR